MLCDYGVITFIISSILPQMFHSEVLRCNIMCFYITRIVSHKNLYSEILKYILLRCPALIHIPSGVSSFGICMRVFVVVRA